MNLLKNNTELVELSNLDLVDTYGGKDTPSGIVQWIGYGAHAVCDYISNQTSGSGQYHDAMSSSNYGGIR